MAVTGITCTTIMEADMRDTKGHTALVALITGVDGTYPAGGIVIDPEWFGLKEIVFVGGQSSLTTGAAGTAQTLTALYSVQATEQPDGSLQFVWVVQAWTGSGWIEVPDGAPMSMPAGKNFSVMVMGNRQTPHGRD